VLREGRRRLEGAGGHTACQRIRRSGSAPRKGLFRLGKDGAAGGCAEP